MINKLLAATSIPLYPSGFQGIGPLGLEGKGGTEEAASLFNQVISKAIGVITIIGFVWFVFLLIMGAFGIMTAGGDKAKMESAQKRITTGLIGLVILVAGVFLLSLIGKILGLPNILNPGQALINLVNGGTGSSTGSGGSSGGLLIKGN